MQKSTVIGLSFSFRLCLCARDSEPTTQLPPRSQLSSLHKAHSLRRKKRRNVLAIFGFRKNRNQSASNQGPEAEAEVVYGDGGHVVATPPTGFVFAGMKEKQLGLADRMYQRSAQSQRNLFVLPPSSVPALPTDNRVIQFTPSSAKTATNIALNPPC